MHKYLWDHQFLEMNDYNCERATVMNHGKYFRHKFHQIIGEHAIHMVDLAIADRKLLGASCKKKLMSTWASVKKLSDEWVSLMCGAKIEGTEFERTIEKLVHLYTEALGDYIIDRKACTKKLQDIARLEGEFYGSLSNHNKETTTKHWNQYTGSVVQMIHTLDRSEKVNSDAFLQSATMCIRAGRLLGMWLDSSLKGS